MAHSEFQDHTPGDYLEKHTRTKTPHLYKIAALIAVALLMLAFNNCGQPVVTSEDKASAANDQTLGGNTGGAGSGTTPPTQTEDPTTKFANIAGVYSGGGPLQIILPDGEYWTIGGYGIIQTRNGKLTQAKDGSFTGEVTAGNGGRGAISGAFSPGVSFNGAAYQASSKTPATITGALGTFWGNSQDGDTPYLTFTANGNITGYSANFSCQFRGKAEPHPSGINILKITLTRSNCLGNGQSTTYVGVARGYGTAVHVVGVNATKTATFTYEGYFESNQ